MPVRGLEFLIQMGDLLHHRILHSPAHKSGGPKKRQALSLARTPVPAAKVSPEQPADRENLAEDKTSQKKKRAAEGTVRGRQSRPDAAFAAQDAAVNVSVISAS